MQQHSSSETALKDELAIGISALPHGLFHSTLGGFARVGEGELVGRMLSWGTSLVVQWLRLHPPNAWGLGSILGQETESDMPRLKSSHAETKDPPCCNENHGMVGTQVAKNFQTQEYFRNQRCIKRKQHSKFSWPTS